MRITLVIPPELIGRDEERVEYLGLGYIAACARRAGHEVHILDCKSESLDHAAAVRKIHGLSPRAIGITAPFTLDLTSAVKLSLDLRSAGFDGAIVIGGHPPTFTFEKLLHSYPEVDAVVRGEGEVTFVEWIKRLERRSDWCRVPGLAYHHDGRIAVTGPAPLVADLDTLPFPARENISTDGVPSSVVWFRRQGLQPGTVILSSRGCPFRCSYCSVQAFYRASIGRPWRARSAQNVVDEMMLLSERWGIHTFRFSDDNFFGSCRAGKTRAQEIAREIIARNLRVNFVIECRTTDVEVSLFSILKRAGLVRVNMGIESGVSRMLEEFQKHASVEQNKRALSVLRDLGLEYHPNFILVDPDTTLKELRANLTFMRETRLYLAPMAMHILYGNRLGLFAGTQITERYAAEGRTFPWRPSGLTEQDKRISETLGAVLDYSERDPQVTVFLRVLNHAISELTCKDAVLQSLERQLRLHPDNSVHLLAGAEPPHGNTTEVLPLVARWRANAGMLAFRLFETALAWAENGRLIPETAEQMSSDLLTEIARYDYVHFGAHGTDFWNTARRSISGEQ